MVSAFPHSAESSTQTPLGANTQGKGERVSLYFTALPAARGHYYLGLRLTFPFLWCALLPKIEAKEHRHLYCFQRVSKMCSIHSLGCQLAMNRRVLLYLNEPEPWHLHEELRKVIHGKSCVWFQKYTEEAKPPKQNVDWGWLQQLGKPWCLIEGRCESKWTTHCSMARVSLGSHRKIGAQQAAPWTLYSSRVIAGAREMMSLLRVSCTHKVAHNLL